MKGAVGGLRWALDNPEPTAKLMVEKYGAPGLNHAAQLQEIKESKPYIEFGPATSKGLLALDLDLYQKIIEIYRKVGMVKTGMTAKDLCDSSYIDAALAGLKA
jgi:hypothetical protein